MAGSIESLMQDNLLAVFNERDPAARRAAIQRTYAPDVRSTDAEGVTTGHDALEAKCVALQKMLGAKQFIADGPVRQVPGFGQPRMTGFDAAVIADGLISELYTVLIPPPA
ncbi:nuclear transport factor 2 family protein [Mycolicibacterium phlei]